MVGSLVDALTLRAQLHGDDPAVRGRSSSYTYRQLTDGAAAIRELLVAAGGAPGDRVAILMATDALSVVASYGVLASEAVAVSMLPVDPPATQAATVERAGAAFVLADEANAEAAEAIAGGRPVIVVSEPLPPPMRALELGMVGPDALAVLLFTSGSTGVPKGVVHSHRTALSLTRRGTHHLDLGPGERVILLRPLLTTAGLAIGASALLEGAEVHTFGISERGVTGLVDFVRDRQITIWSSPPTIMRHVARTLRRGERLASVRRVRLGAEPCTGDDLELVRGICAPDVVVSHSYAASEIGGVARRAYGPDDPAPAGFLSPGLPLERPELLLLDPDGDPVPAGEVGEVVVRGDEIALGYWQEPDLTSARFADDPLRPGARRYRTGDLGRLGPDGELEIVGRADDQVKVRGFLVLLSAVQLVVGQHPDVAGAVVVAHQTADGDHRIGAHLVARAGRALDVADLREWAAARLPSPAVPTSFTTHAVIPTIGPGKPDRRRLAALDAAAAARDDAPPTEAAPATDAVEAAVVAAWSAAFERDAVGPGSDFFQLGGDSLTAAVIAARVHDTTGVELDLAAFAANRTVRQMADAVRARVGDTSGPPLVRAARDRTLAASTAQERTFRFCNTPDDNVAYTTATVTEIDGPLDLSAFRAAVEAVHRRHEALRTTFERSGDLVVQCVHREPVVDLRVSDGAPGESAARLSALVAEPFDLGTLPLLRFELVRLGPDRHLLLRTAHHIITDAWSWRVLVDELDAAYRAHRSGVEPRSPLVIQVADHAAWEREHLRPGSALYDEQLTWWGRQLTGLGPPLALPFEAPDPSTAATPCPDDGVLELPLAAGSEVVRRAARQLGVTVNGAVIGAHAALLHAATGADDVLFGVYASVRRRTELQRLIGFFMNVLALRFSEPGAATAAAWTTRTRELLEAASARAELPWEEVRSYLAVNEPPGPDIRAMYNQHPPRRTSTIGDLRVGTPRSFTARMPWGMTTLLRHRDDELVLATAFDAARYEPSSVAAYVRALGDLVVRMASEPDAPVSRLAAQAWDRRHEGATPVRPLPLP